MSAPVVETAGYWRFVPWEYHYTIVPNTPDHDKLSSCLNRGWAARFLKAGVAAFVGTHWSVYDAGARQFCEVFYDRILNGTTVGEASREARLTIRKAGEPTWLAYTVFGDPVACVKPANLV